MQQLTDSNRKEGFETYFCMTHTSIKIVRPTELAFQKTIASDHLADYIHMSIHSIQGDKYNNLISETIILQLK